MSNNSQVDTVKKAGPVVPEEDLASSRVLGAVECKTVLIKYLDEQGREQVRFAVVIPGGRTHLMREQSIDDKPLTKAMSDGIAAHLARKAG